MRLLTAGSLVRVQQGEPKKALAFASAFFNEINPFRDLWNALRAWNTPTACEIAAAVRIYFISLDAKHQISQFVEQIISPWAKRTISLFVWTKRFEYWARSVSRLGAPRCLRQMKRCSEQEETTSIATRSKRARRLCFWPKGSLVRVQQGEPSQKPWASTGSGLFHFLKQFEISVCLTLFNVSMWIFCTIFIYWHYHWLWYNQFVE